MAIKLKMEKEETFMGDDTWITNGHWLLRRADFPDTFKLPAWYEGVLVTSVVFARQGENPIMIGDEVRDSDFEAVYRDAEIAGPIKLHPVTSNGAHAVEVVEGDCLVWVNASYAEILTTGHWRITKDLRQLIWREGDDVLGVLMLLDPTTFQSYDNQIALIADKVKATQAELELVDNGD